MHIWLAFFWFENMGSSWCLASESPSICSKYFKRLSTVTSPGSNTSSKVPQKKTCFSPGKLFPASFSYCTRQLMPSQVVFNMFFNDFEFISEFIPCGEPVCRQRASYCHIRIIPAMQLAQLDLKSAFSRNNLAINLQIPLPVIVLWNFLTFGDLCKTHRT